MLKELLQEQKERIKNSEINKKMCSIDEKFIQIDIETIQFR
jgi:hypothetical protein